MWSFCSRQTIKCQRQSGERNAETNERAIAKAGKPITPPSIAFVPFGTHARQHFQGKEQDSVMAGDANWHQEATFSGVLVLAQVGIREEAVTFSGVLYADYSIGLYCGCHGGGIYTTEILHVRTSKHMREPFSTHPW